MIEVEFTVILFWNDGENPRGVLPVSPADAEKQLERFNTLYEHSAIVRVSVDSGSVTGDLTPVT